MVTVFNLLWEPLYDQYKYHSMFIGPPKHFQQSQVSQCSELIILKEGHSMPNLHVMKFYTLKAQ